MTHVQPYPTIRVLSLVSSFWILQSLLWSEGEMHWNVFHVQEFITLYVTWLPGWHEAKKIMTESITFSGQTKMAVWIGLRPEAPSSKLALEALTNPCRETAQMSSGEGQPQTSANQMTAISFPFEKVTLKVSTSKCFSGKCGWCTHPGCLSAPTTETESFASLWHCGKWCV